nr:helix-turn-helix domain-containing protein [Pegethrix bostrychoides GSE-TBD4-15B]
MENQDARDLTQAVQQYLRQQAIRLREQGKPVTEIATYLGVHRNTIADWWWQYQQYGED